jgi:hypothetical protein
MTAATATRPRVTPLVKRSHRQGRSPERTCYCDAVTFPHRLDSVPGCYGGLVCHHGLPMAGHPDYEWRCTQCDREEYDDIVFDRWHDEHSP